MVTQPLTPPIYEVVEAPTPQTTIFEFLLGALGIVAAIAVVAVVLGLGFAGVLIAIRKTRGEDRLGGGGSDATRLELNTPLRANVAPADAEAEADPPASAAGERP